MSIEVTVPAQHEIAWALMRIERSRSVHLAWVDHLRSHKGDAPCPRCPPDIGHSVGDVDHHLSVAADYERVLNVLRAEGRARAHHGELVRFFCDEEQFWGLKGDYEDWSTERTAIELIRHLRRKLVDSRGRAPTAPLPCETPPLLLACERCGAVIHETLNSRSASDKCSLVYANRNAPCEGRLRPLRPTPEAPMGEGDFCDVNVYQDGETLEIVALTKAQAEVRCAELRVANPGYLVDWHFAAGRVVLKRLKAPTPDAGARRISPEAVKTLSAIAAWQANASVHPLTCGNDSRHPKLIGAVYDGRVVLVCLGIGCDYIQTHIPEVVRVGTPDAGPGEPCDVCSRADPHTHCPECGSTEHAASNCDMEG